MIRKAKLSYEIVYDYRNLKRYELVTLKTHDRNEAILGFLELFRMKQSGSLILESDCHVILRVKITSLIRDGIDLMEYKEDDNLNEILDKKEKRITTSYENFIYTIKLATNSGFIKNYKPIFQTENRDEALEKFLKLFRQKQLYSSIQENNLDVVLEVAVSPFDQRCIYLEFVKEESYIFSTLTKLEQMVINDFNY